MDQPTITMSLSNYEQMQRRIAYFEEQEKKINQALLQHYGQTLEVFLKMVAHDRITKMRGPLG